MLHCHVRPGRLAPALPARASAPETVRKPAAGCACGPAKGSVPAGIARYAKHLRGVIAKSARTHRERLVAAEGKGEKHAHLAALSAILQTVAAPFCLKP